MKIASFNINGINARVAALGDWLDEADMDVVVLQELKSVDENVPREMFEDRGYILETHGQKTPRPAPNMTTSSLGWIASAPAQKISWRKKSRF